MLIFNKFKFKEIDGPCTLVGPQFPAASQYKFNVDGNILEVAFPKQRSRIPAEPAYPKSNYTLDSYNLKDISSDCDEWKGFWPIKQIWDFYGSAFTGKQGEIYFTLSILRPSTINREVSMFHPRAFEHTVGNFLTTRYASEFLQDSDAGVATGTKASRWSAPEKWTPISCGDVQGAKFHVLPAIGQHEKHINLMLPLNDHFFVVLEFQILWSHILDENDEVVEGANRWLDTSRMHQLVGSIIDSLSLTLTAENRVKRDQELENLDNPRLAETYPPLKWNVNSVSKASNTPKIT